MFVLCAKSPPLFIASRRYRTASLFLHHLILHGEHGLCFFVSLETEGRKWSCGNYGGVTCCLGRPVFIFPSLAEGRRGQPTESHGPARGTSLLCFSFSPEITVRQRSSLCRGGDVKSVRRELVDLVLLAVMPALMFAERRPLQQGGREYVGFGRRLFSYSDVSLHSESCIFDHITHRAHHVKCVKSTLYQCRGR